MKTLAAGIAVATAFSFTLTAIPAHAAPGSTGSASAVTTRALPPGSVRHQAGPYWVWFGPNNWSAAGGAYGILILGPGKRTLDYGFSSTVCANGATLNDSVKNYFAGQRKQLKQKGIKKLKLKAGKIKQLSAASFGPNYFRQIVEFSGRTGKTNIRGEIYYDYSINDHTYCFTRSQSRTAPASGYNRSIKQLRSIQSTLAYSGPGA